MKVTKQETNYHKDHGATLKHRYEKRIVALPLFIFLSFFGPFFLLAFLLFFSLAFFWAFFWPFLFFYFWGQYSNNDDHHTFMDLQLKNYNSKLEQDMTLYECLRRCTGMGNESRVTCMK